MVCMYYISVPQLIPSYHPEVRSQTSAFKSCIRHSALHTSHLFPSLGNANGHLVSFRPLLVSFFVFRTVTGPQPQRPHPAAPAQFKEAFSDFLEKYKKFSFPLTSSSNGQSSGRKIFNEFWEAPEYLWRPKLRQLEDSEIDAVSVSRIGFDIPFFGHNLHVPRTM